MKMSTDPQKPVDSGDADPAAFGGDEGDGPEDSAGGADALDPESHAATTKSVAIPSAKGARNCNRNLALMGPTPL